MSSSSDQGSEVSAFSDLLNARCAELGLLTAPEIARRINEVQPATSNVDLARSVRNWQAGRNIPRPDFYRIILSALGVDADPELRARWHIAYERARSGRIEKPSSAKADAAEAAADRPTVVAAPANGASTTRKSKQAVPTVERRRKGRFAAVLAVAGLAVAVAFAALRAGTDFGLACDKAAGARWDPQRNTTVETPDFLDIRASAIDACEEAVRQHPRQARYWFQLGRAHDRDAKWHGRHDKAVHAFRHAHEMKYPAATLSLGMLYEDGASRPTGLRRRQPDLLGAATLYRQAAAAGLPHGLYCHSVATLFGWANERPDPAAATGIAEAAVAAGSRRARGLAAELKAKRSSTRHVECSHEHGLKRPPQQIAWNGVEEDVSAVASRLSPLPLGQTGENASR